ncbi:lachesin [Caerostris extrusa]|uniref:Lachesin n=1 Tax=Caerostris extrusa TaxID=172846 RepID=A0AAV4X3T0_CAEEX|nr:lachesin [Caerostris extrusa]
MPYLGGKWRRAKNYAAINTRTTNEADPEFSEAIPNITIPVGRDIQLPCIVDNLGSYRAAWIKVETKAILTIHHHIITRNYRISLSHSDNRNFVLHIRNVQKSDRGGYMCQINTAPMKSQIGYVDVLGESSLPLDLFIASKWLWAISNVGFIVKKVNYLRLYQGNFSMGFRKE